jgi:hypothetical protein
MVSKTLLSWEWIFFGKIYKEEERVSIANIVRMTSFFPGFMEEEYKNRLL